MKTRTRPRLAGAKPARHGKRKLSSLLPTWETMRLAAVALSFEEWCCWMEDVLYFIDTKVRDGHADNARLIQAYIKGSGL
jgi:predicted metal-dependent HD superfamily phosphohydrolase